MANAVIARTICLDGPLTSTLPASVDPNHGDARPTEAIVCYE
jgi:hypothetical protein